SCWRRVAAKVEAALHVPNAVIAAATSLRRESRNIVQSSRKPDGRPRHARCMARTKRCGQYSHRPRQGGPVGRNVDDWGHEQQPPGYLILQRAARKVLVL